MFNIHSVEIDWGGRPLRLETGKIARQADGAVLATYGETVVLATVVAAHYDVRGCDEPKQPIVPVDSHVVPGPPIRVWPTVDPFEELAETVAPVGAFTLLGAEKGCMFLKESTRAFNVARAELLHERRQRCTDCRFLIHDDILSPNPQVR